MANGVRHIKNFLFSSKKSIAGDQRPRKNITHNGIIILFITLDD
jgi:hypothetical protein